jgi:hypothetical protein
MIQPEDDDNDALEGVERPIGIERCFCAGAKKENATDEHRSESRYRNVKLLMMQEYTVYCLRCECVVADRG